MVTRRQSILLLIASICIIFSFAGCKGKGAKRPPAVKAGPAAEAKQTLPTPTLAPSASEVQAKAKEKEEETPAPATPAPQPIPE
ncbi:MAG TPA: hypothetical protein PLY45_06580, partial [bacterium]|nr:hypothetical protein [bacterium]